MDDLMPAGTQAFIVTQGNQVVNKIVPVDPVQAYEDIKRDYSDPSYDVLFFGHPEDPNFVNTNGTIIQGE